jgi:hypothetical protein
MKDTRKCQAQVLDFPDSQSEQWLLVVQQLLDT